MPLTITMALRREARRRLIVAAAAAAIAAARVALDWGTIRQDIIDSSLEAAFMDLDEAYADWHRVVRRHDPVRHGALRYWQPARDRMRVIVLLEKRIRRG